MLPERTDLSVELSRRVRVAIGDAKADRWFGPQTNVEFDGQTLVVRAATSFLLKYLQQQYGRLVAEQAGAILGQTTVPVQFEVDESLAATAAPQNASASNLSAARSSETGRSGASRPTRGNGLDLDHFVTGDCNRVAFNAAELIAAQPVGTTGVMVFFGPVGVGKTHLLEGIAGRVRSNKLARVMTINGPQFGNLFKQAMSEYATASFRQRFNSVDLLCVDDLDFFESKRSFQDELLQTIDRIEARGGTVLVTATLHPKVLTGLSDTLISRLLAGPVCRIEKPGQDVRRAVAMTRAKAVEANLTNDAIRYAADRFAGSVREVVGAINTLNAHAISTGQRVTLSSARQILISLERDAAQVVRIADIEAAVAKLFGLPPTEMRSSRRSRVVSQPRQVAMYLSRKLTNEAYQEIGTHFGGRNHSTVMAAERSVKKMLRDDVALRIGFQELPVSEVVARLEEQIRVG